MEQGKPLEKISRPKFFYVSISIFQEIDFFSDILQMYFCWTMEQGHPDPLGLSVIFNDICEVKDPENNTQDKDAAIREVVTNFWQDELIKQRRSHSSDTYRKKIVDDSAILYISLLEENEGLPKGLRIDAREYVYA